MRPGPSPGLGPTQWAVGAHSLLASSPVTAVPGITGDETEPGSSAPSLVIPSGTMALRHAEARFLRAPADQRHGSFSRTYRFTFTVA
jgi:hypothetical protein